MHRYNEVALLVRKRITAGTLKVGDRLPSVRQMSLITGYSTVTVHHGYELLESQGICEARPRSGFYVAKIPQLLTQFPTSGDQADKEPVPTNDFQNALLLQWKQPGLEAFGASYPADDLFPRSYLDAVLRKFLRHSAKRNGSSYAPEGDPLLRQVIARRMAARGIFVRPDEVIVTGSSMQAYNLCLDVLTEPGDIIIVESPSYFPMLACLKRRNLNMIELYSHPIHGADPNQFEYLCKNNNIKIAILMPSNHYPTGITYSPDKLESIVKIASKYNVSLIENDTLGDIGYDHSPALSLKNFDQDDIVLQFSSFECSMPRDYGFGWVLAGPRAKELLTTQYMNGYHAREGVIQSAVAEFLSNRSHDRHLRGLREELANRMQIGAELVAQSFPQECSMSRPNGGYMCWIRGPSQVEMRDVYLAAVKQGFSFLPGEIFSIAGSFRNFLALNFSFAWTPERMERALDLGRIIRDVHQRRRG